MAVGIATSGFVLIATPDSLRLETSGLFWATSCNTWKKQEIELIRADTKIDYDRGSEDPPLIMTRVLIHTTDSIDPEPDEIKLEGSISKPEGQWIATTLRGARCAGLQSPSRQCDLALNGSIALDFARNRVGVVGPTRKIR